MTSTAGHPLLDGRTEGSALVQALRGARPTRTPVWIPGPRRSATGFGGSDASWLDASLDPAEVTARTVEPVDRLGTDAAVLRTDIALPLRLAGIDVDIVPGRGPVVANPIRSASDVLRLVPLDPAALEPIRAAVALSVAALGATPLIGLAGAPYTLASMLVEGGASQDRLRTRTMMYAEPHAWAGLLNWCADVSGEFLRAQVDAGASVAQLVDPLVGTLSRHDYFKRAVPHSQRALWHLRGTTVPIIHAGTGSGDFLDVMAGAGADAVGVDWRTPLDEAARRVGPDITLQGNIDPALLRVPWRILRAHVDDVLVRGLAARAHVVALGGDLPDDVDPDVLARVVRVVHGDEPLD